MKLTDMLRLYFRSGGKGRMANRLERDALSDPFLFEALEGLQGTVDPGKSIGLLRAKLKKRAGYFRRKRYIRLALWGVLLAGVVVLLVYLIEGKKTTELQPFPAPSTNRPIVSDIPESVKPSRKKPEPDAMPAGDEFAGAVGEERLVAGPSPERERTGRLVEVENTSQPGSVPVVSLEAYDRYIRDSLRYPPDALEQKLEGKIKLSFIVNRYGRPSRIRVVEWISHSCNREAIRLLDKGPVWTYTGSQEPTCLTIPFQIPDAAGK